MNALILGQPLTPRERDVCVKLVDGRNNKQMARELGVSPRTIETHRKRIFAKMGVTNAVQLCRLVMGEERKTAEATT